MVGVHLSRLSYLADFFIAPALILFAFCYAISSGVTWWFVPAAVFGFVAWNPIEYCIHRFLLHDFYRRDHWLHHLQPRRNIGAPSWLTLLLQGSILAALVSALGPDGAGAYCGLAFGYLCYILAHFTIHRFSIPPSHWLYPVYLRHALHHKGKEVNFNVLWPWTDRLCGTFEQPGG